MLTKVTQFVIDNPLVKGYFIKFNTINFNKFFM